jgi:hypothetical protein
MQVMQHRRKRLTEICTEVLKARGYVLGPSLRVPGAHSFSAERNGTVVRIGIKTGADRWVSVPEPGKGLLAVVDEIFVVAFDHWPIPGRIQVYRFEADLIARKAKTVYQAADYKRLQFLALDKIDEMDRAPTTVVVDQNLKADGELFFDEPIEWTDNPSSLAVTPTATAPPPPAVPPAATAPSSPPVAPATSAAPAVAREVPIMEHIKGILAEHLGVRPDLIEIDVRVKI